MSEFAVSEVLANVDERFAAERTEDAFALFDAYLPLIRYEQQPGIGLASTPGPSRRQAICPRGTPAPSR